MILSAKTIPGNEAEVAALVKGFQAQGAKVLSAETDDALDLHASGHPNQDELTALYNIAQPNLVIPVHGEPQHLKENAKIAKAAGAAATLVGRNGDLFVCSTRNTTHPYSNSADLIRIPTAARLRRESR